MASLTIDLSGHSQQIISAVTAAMKNVQRDTATAAARPSNKEKFDISGVCDQILDNTRTLYYITHANGTNTPHLSTITLGSGTCISAAVIYNGVAGSGSSARRMVVLLESPRTSSMESALQGLLTLSSNLLAKEWKSKAIREFGCQAFNGDDGFSAFPAPNARG